VIWFVQPEHVGESRDAHSNFVPFKMNFFSSLGRKELRITDSKGAINSETSLPYLASCIYRSLCRGNTRC
jgi:hypothetical protein